MAFFETYADDGALQLSAELMHYFCFFKQSYYLNDNSLFIPFEGGYSPGGSDRYTLPIFEGNNPPGNSSRYFAWSCSEPITTLMDPAIAITRSTNSPIATCYGFAPFSEYVPTSNAGLQVFDSAGTLVYDITAKPMIVARKQVTGITYPGMDVPIGLPAGREYAAFITTQSARVTGPLPNWSDPQAYGHVANSAGFAFRMQAGDVRITEYSRQQFSEMDLGNGQLVVLDVTGY